MRHLLFLFLMAVTTLPALPAQAGNTVTMHFKVSGVCEQCKTRIEAGAYVKGVRYASWDIDTHELTVKFDSSKTTPQIILKSIAKAGHDNELFKAEDVDYNKVTNCCKYRSGIKKH